MKPADNEQLLELMTWMGTLPGVEDQDVVRVRSWFCVAEYTDSDYREMSSFLLDHDATAGFAFCARDVDRYGGTMRELAADGHEIVFHGNRHTMFADLSYKTARDYLSTGLEAIETAAGVRPTGFFVPWMDCTQGTLDASAELDIEWMYANPEDGADIPDSISIVEPVMPPDSVRLEQGADPQAMMAEFAADATDGSSFLFHPPFLQYYDATDEFEAWVENVSPVSVAHQLNDGGVGLVLDSIQPLRLE